MKKLGLLFSMVVMIVLFGFSASAATEGKYTYEIQNGDRIDIITSQNSKGPSRDWLSMVKSAQAKSKINQWFRSQLKDENILKGKELIIAYAKAKGLPYHDFYKPEYQEKVQRKYGFHSWDDCLATIGHGGIKEGQIANRMYEEYKKDDVAASFQKSVCDVLSDHLIAAAKKTGCTKIAIAGGVAANSLLRQTVEQKKGSMEFYYPPLILCTDNAAMIACSGYYEYIKGNTKDMSLNAIPYLGIDLK